MLGTLTIHSIFQVGARRTERIMRVGERVCQRLADMCGVFFVGYSIPGTIYATLFSVGRVVGTTNVLGLRVCLAACSGCVGYVHAERMFFFADTCGGFFVKVIDLSVCCGWV